MKCVRKRKAIYIAAHRPDIWGPEATQQRQHKCVLLVRCLSFQREIRSFSLMQVYIPFPTIIEISLC